MASYDSSINATSVPTRSSPWAYAIGGGLAALILAALVAYLFWPTGGPAAGGGGAPADGGFGFGPSPVEVVAAVEVVTAEPVQLLGSVAPLRQAVVAAQVEGAVESVAVDEGDRVRQGQVLVRLRTKTMGLELSAAEASREEAAARLQRLEAELARVTSLHDRGAVSDREYEQAVADRDAQRQLVARFEADAARLRDQIERAEIVAPFAGQVSAVHVEVGEWLARGGDVVTLMDLSSVEVTVQVPERYVGQVEEARRSGGVVPVEFDALQGRYEGKVKAVVPQANPQARTFPVIVSVSNSDGRIRGGMFVRVLAQIGDPTPTVLVPKDALVLRSGRTFVYRVVAGGGGRGPQGGGQAPAPGGGEPGQSGGEGQAQGGGGRGDRGGPPPSVVEEIEVNIGAGYGAWQTVKGGVAEGDLVVVRGNESLRAGAPVMVSARAEIEPPPAPAADLPMGVRRGEGGG